MVLPVSAFIFGVFLILIINLGMITVFDLEIPLTVTVDVGWLMSLGSGLLFLIIYIILAKRQCNK